MTPGRLPTGGQYQAALQNPSRCFIDPVLGDAAPERTALGLPKPISGNFASVFPMTAASGERYAVKCFTREAPHQLQRYETISARLRALRPRWAVDFEFQPEGIRVEGVAYPILRMEWIDAVSLTRWVDGAVGRPGEAARLADRFDAVVAELAAAGIAHGDLQHGNVLVRPDGELRIIDYDGMYLPDLAGLPSDEVGHPNFQPPGRTPDDYGPHLDRFSARLISLSLRALDADPDLWDRCNPDHEEYLLLDQSDFAAPQTSERLALLLGHGDPHVRAPAEFVRDCLPLPLASMPELPAPPKRKRRSRRLRGTAKSVRRDAVPGVPPSEAESPGGRQAGAPSPLPSWLAGHMTGSPAQAAPRPPSTPGAPPHARGAPGTAPPGTAAHSTARPGSAQPGPAGSGAAGPGMAAPGTTARGPAAPGAPHARGAPGTATPGTAARGTAAPATAGPGATTSGAATPGTATPGTAGPGTAGPGTATSGAAGPGAVTGSAVPAAAFGGGRVAWAGAVWAARGLLGFVLGGVVVAALGFHSLGTTVALVGVAGMCGVLLRARRTRAAVIAGLERRRDEVDGRLREIAEKYDRRRTDARDACRAEHTERTRRRDELAKEIADAEAERKAEEQRILARRQDEHVAARLAGATLAPRDVDGLTALDVVHLKAAGIRGPADFTGISYRPGRRPSPGARPVQTAYLRRPDGTEITVTGIGEAKARRLEWWRNRHLALARRDQPVHLTREDEEALDDRYAARLSALRDAYERARDRAADPAPKEELNRALRRLDSEQHDEQKDATTARTEIGRELQTARAGNQAAAPSLSRFIGRVLRGR